MEQQTSSPITGSYTASLIGNIRGHLAGLQGYDVMALELIQNADDAHADSIIFNITDEGLYVSNNSEFSYCGNLMTRPCSFIDSIGKSCDFHRISDIGSGEKIASNENIGRFGIGFVSTYQVTDEPEIRSQGINLTLQPKTETWSIRPFSRDSGTTFFLPWAQDENSETRILLGVSHISKTHISQLFEDIKKVLKQSLIFLRHIKRATLQKNGQPVFFCEIEHGSDSVITIRFMPGNSIEMWHILRSDAKKAAEGLYSSFPRLEKLRRHTDIKIGIRLIPEPVLDGLLFAYLPTKQATGLPIHINADFFPEADRKSLIFSGNQHEQKWNEMLITNAAILLASNLEGLMQSIGHEQIWNIINRSTALSQNDAFPTCFSSFWEILKVAGSNSRIALDSDGRYQYPRDLFVQKPEFESIHLEALSKLGAKSASDVLQSYYNPLRQMGAQILTLEKLADLMKAAKFFSNHTNSYLTELELMDFLIPLWEIIERMLPEEKNQSNIHIVRKLLEIPFVLTEDLFLTKVDLVYVVKDRIISAKVSSLLPTLKISSVHLTSFHKIIGHIPPLDFHEVVMQLNVAVNSKIGNLEGVIKLDNMSLSELYSLLYELDIMNQGNVVTRATRDYDYRLLASLPIWASNHGMLPARDAMLPGDFHDPTALSNLLDTSVLSKDVQEFLVSKLGVRRQSIEEFVISTLPKFFTDNGPVDPKQYCTLIVDLANSASIINNPETRKILSALPLVPTQDGLWSTPNQAYFRTDELADILGEAKHLWIDKDQIPYLESVSNFFKSLGILEKPIANHLADRIIDISCYQPNEEARHWSEKAFYCLCDLYDEGKDTKFFRDAIDSMKSVQCFPVDGDYKDWHSSDTIYAPYRADAFRSQAKILDFKNPTRLKSELLKLLDIKINPETDLVINHLLHHVKNHIPPTILVYTVLNERAQVSDSQVIKLADVSCIYVQSTDSFVRPDHLYWTQQHLGSYAYTIPANLNMFRPLFDMLGAKDSPEAVDFIDIILEIIKKYYGYDFPIDNNDRIVYEACYIWLSSYNKIDKLEPSEIQPLCENPSILNLLGYFVFPDEVIFKDSEWHAQQFDDVLNSALCNPSQEIWDIYKEIGVKRLSELSEMTLDAVEGESVTELSIATKLKDRREIIVRLLHAQSSDIRKKLNLTLENIGVVSFDSVRIQTKVILDNKEVFSEPKSIPAYYNIAENQLVLQRPVDNRSWTHIFRAIYLQLMPTESIEQIQTMILLVIPRMSMPLADVYQELADNNIPSYDFETNPVVTGLLSPQLDDLGTLNEEKTGLSEDNDSYPTTSTSELVKESDFSSKNNLDDNEASNKGSMTTDSRGGSSESNARANTPFHNGTLKKPDRPAFKNQWDRKLISYVNKNISDSENTNEQNNDHNLAVEVVARQAVCEYEKSHNRMAIQMAQTHPGYDIESQDSTSGEMRYIEIKSLSGEWNQVGVGLSHYQFGCAQRLTSNFWLYVVEFVSDPENIRIYPICDPFSQISEYRFDKNWREIAIDEQRDPILDFVSGVKIEHNQRGKGSVLSVRQQGSMILLEIQFENMQQPTPNIPLNLKQIRIVED